MVLLFCMPGHPHLVTHVGFLSAVRLHVLCESFLHGIDPVTHRAGELGHPGTLRYMQSNLLQHENTYVTTHSL